MIDSVTEGGTEGRQLIHNEGEIVLCVLDIKPKLVTLRFRAWLSLIFQPCPVSSLPSPDRFSPLLVLRPLSGWSAVIPIGTTHNP